MRGVAALLVVDRGGVVIASENPASCGTRLQSPVFRQRLDRALDGPTQFVRPVPDRELAIEGANGQLRPLAWFIAPIRTGSGPATVALALGVVADRDFAAVFSAARPGNTTEAYAFADDGLMLTPSRFAEYLVEAGLLAEGKAAAAFSISVRDPGDGTEAGASARLDPAARPLTHAAALAVAARGKLLDSDRVGRVTQPYRSYRGEDVVGAWRWLPGYGIGIVAEIAASEVFATLRYLWISFAVIGAFTVISLGAALTSGLSLSRLQRQFGRLQRLGAYTLERQISEGGMATIYLARHALLKRPTAIKILKKHVATDESVHRFQREVQLASQLVHPNTVRIYDFGRTREGQPYYVMEYLDGVTLAQLVAETGPVPAGRVVHILRQVAAALREAHEHGLIHRDVKPENIMLCRRGEDDVVKLLDFGLVKDLETAQTRDVTKQVRILGTPRYMSPERILNPADVDARSDIYALGAVGYYLLTGTPVFDGADNLEVSNKVLHAPAPRASASGIAGIPEGLDALIAACLEKERARRPQAVLAVIEALDRLAARLAWTQTDAATWWAAHRQRHEADAAAAPGRHVGVGREGRSARERCRTAARRAPRRLSPELPPRLDRHRTGGRHAVLGFFLRPEIPPRAPRIPGHVLAVGKGLDEDLLRVLGQLHETELFVAPAHDVERARIGRRLRKIEQRALRAIGRRHIGAAPEVVHGHVGFVGGHRVVEIAHARDRILVVLAVRKAGGEFLERRERRAHLLRVAFGEVELVHVADEALVLPEVDETLQVVRVVDVRMIGIGADEAVRRRDGGRLFAAAPVRVGGFEDGLLRIAAVRDSAPRASRRASWPVYNSPRASCRARSCTGDPPTSPPFLPSLPETARSRRAPAPRTGRPGTRALANASRGTRRRGDAAREERRPLRVRVGVAHR